MGWLNAKSSLKIATLIDPSIVALHEVRILRSLSAITNGIFLFICFNEIWSFVASVNLCIV